jgi:hypothetical protein
VIVTRVVRLVDGEELVSCEADVPEAYDNRGPRARVSGRRRTDEPERVVGREAGQDELSLAAARAVWRAQG